LGDKNIIQSWISEFIKLFNMTPQEIQERNKQIALMLGGYKCSKISEQYELPKLMTFPPKGNSNLCHTAKVCMLEDMQFHADWNWLHEAVQFLYKEMYWTGIERYRLYSEIESVFVMISGLAKLYNEKKLYN
jgi:hypothetical protein